MRSSLRASASLRYVSHKCSINIRILMASESLRTPSLYIHVSDVCVFVFGCVFVCIISVCECYIYIFVMCVCVYTHTYSTHMHTCTHVVYTY
jgi:hypothetical protein